MLKQLIVISYCYKLIVLIQLALLMQTLIGNIAWIKSGVSAKNSYIETLTDLENYLGNIFF